jgi:ubiquinone/menaquinone biosynthesis C-methylase UbiE
MSRLTRTLDQLLYPGVDGHWDDQLFRERILRHIKPDSVVLDVGAGAGIVAEMNLRGMVKRVCGVDPDPRVAQNPYLDDAKLGTGEAIPYPDATFDVVFADNVLEHLPDPVAVLREVHRVLKPGGAFLAKTPNSWHYMPLIARLTPHSFHRFVNRIRGRAEVDTFPTQYRANSKSVVTRLASQTGFDPVSIERIEGRPEYLRISAPTYLIGWLYEKLVNASSLFERFRILLVICLRKR